MNSIIITTNDSNSNSKKTFAFQKILNKPVIDYYLDTIELMDINKSFILFDSNILNLDKYSLNNNLTFDLSQTSSLKDLSNSLLKKNTIISFGDTPFISNDTLYEAEKLHVKENNDITFITKDTPNNSISYIIKTDILKEYLNSSTNIKNIIDSFSTSSFKSNSFLIDSSKNESFQVLSMKDLHFAINFTKILINEIHLENDVLIMDFNTTFISPDTTIGSNTIIYPNTHLEGKVVIGSDCIIYPNTRILNSTVGSNTSIDNSIILDSSIGKNCSIGPFAYIRPNSKIGDNVKIGDFVEVKNSIIKNGTKASHLTYIGDSDVGEKVNFGCGTVTVNYDGKKKYRTIIGDNVFIGCNANLVAPVNIEDNSYIAAGSTITDDIPKNSLAIARERQIIKKDWCIKRNLEGK